jgi:hypothetical protein
MHAVQDNLVGVREIRLDNLEQAFQGCFCGLFFSFIQVYDNGQSCLIPRVEKLLKKIDLSIAKDGGGSSDGGHIRGSNERNFVKELIRCNDPVLISYILAVLKDEGIEAVVLDEHTSILEGSINAIQRRIMVAEADHAAAQVILEDIGEAEVKD